MSKNRLALGISLSLVLWCFFFEWNLISTLISFKNIYSFLYGVFRNEFAVVTS